MTKPKYEIGDRDYCLVCGGLIGYEGDVLCAFCQSNDNDDNDEDE